MHRIIFNLPKIFVITHACWIIFVFLLVHEFYEGTGNKEELQIWILIILPDYPVMFLFVLFDNICDGWMFISRTFSEKTADLIYPFIFYFVLGSMQWWLCGVGLCRLTQRFYPYRKNMNGTGEGNCLDAEIAVDRRRP